MVEYYFDDGEREVSCLHWALPVMRVGFSCCCCDRTSVSDDFTRVKRMSSASCTCVTSLTGVY